MSPLPLFPGSTRPKEADLKSIQVQRSSSKCLGGRAEAPLFWGNPNPAAQADTHEHISSSRPMSVNDDINPMADAARLRAASRSRAFPESFAALRD